MEEEGVLIAGRYYLMECIGEGAFGEIFRGIIYSLY